VRKLVIMGVAAALALAGIALGAVGAAIAGRDPFVPLPEVHIAPAVIFHLGGFGVTNSLLSAWLTCLVVVLLFGLGTRRMALVPGRMQAFLELLVEFLYGFIRNVAGEKYARRFFPILATIFIFVAFNAWMALLPIYPTVGFKPEGAEHVTTHLLRSAGTDINMPLALAIISFLFVEIWGFKAHRVGYMKEFIRPGGIQTFVGILELLSHFIRLVSFTFRLFGNMLAGELVLFMMTYLLVFLSPVVFYFLELLVGGVQALIFMGLTVVFAATAVAEHGGHHDEEHAEAAAH
jgi:F-type H+-transporting ATPase subunit a